VLLVVKFLRLTPFAHEAAKSSRDVAQPGRALAWGARGRQFKSARPDHFLLSAFSNGTALADGWTVFEERDPGIEGSRTDKFKFRSRVLGENWFSASVP
jgi:hypothetical protein